jgi:hypothetical protein
MAIASANAAEGWHKDDIRLLGIGGHAKPPLRKLGIQIGCKTGFQTEIQSVKVLQDIE